MLDWLYTSGLECRGVDRGLQLSDKGQYDGPIRRNLLEPTLHTEHQEHLSRTTRALSGGTVDSRVLGERYIPAIPTCLIAQSGS
jgi:hypothetical protein